MIVDYLCTHPSFVTFIIIILISCWFIYKLFKIHSENFKYVVANIRHLTIENIFRRIFLSSEFLILIAKYIIICEIVINRTIIFDILF